MWMPLPWCARSEGPQTVGGLCEARDRIGGGGVAADQGPGQEARKDGLRLCAARSGSRHSDGERLPADGIGAGLASGKARGAQASILSPPLYRRTRAGALQGLSPPVIIIIISKVNTAYRGPRWGSA